MAVIAVVGGPGAPGATTTALALLLSWPLAAGRKVLLAECDPDGGAVLAGALEGRVEAVYGLRNLAVADRRGLLAQAIWDQLVDVSPAGDGSRLLLPGLTDPAQAAGLAYTWEPLVETLHALEPQGYDVLLDLGRSGALGPGAVLARRADAVVATLRTTLRGLSSARPRLAALREDLESAGTGADGLGLLLIAEGPYPAADVVRQFELPVLGLLPYAPRTARVLSDGGDSTDRRFIRSELMRTARTAADRMQAVVAKRRERVALRVPAAADAVGAADGTSGADAWTGPDGRTASDGPVAPGPAYGWSAPAAEPAAEQQQPYSGGQSAYTPPSGQVFGPPAVAGQQPAQPYGGAAGYPHGQAYAPSSGQVYAPPEESAGAASPPSVPQPYQVQPEPQAYRPPAAPGVYQAPAGRVFVPRTGPVRVQPTPEEPVGAGQPAPPLAGIAPHPAAPEPFRAPTGNAETQGEVLRAR